MNAFWFFFPSSLISSAPRREGRTGGWIYDIARPTDQPFGDGSALARAVDGARSRTVRRAWYSTMRFVIDDTERCRLFLVVRS